MELSKKSSWKRTATSLAKIAFASGIVIWLISSGRFDLRLLAQLWSPVPIFVGLLLIALNWAAASERWRGILNSQGFIMSPWDTMRLTMIGSFFNFVIPSGVGGDVVKGYFIARDNPQARVKAVLTIAVDRLLGLFSMVLMAIVVILYDWDLVQSKPELRALATLVVLIFLAFMIFWILIFSRRVVSTGWTERLLARLPFSKRTTQIYHSIAEYRFSKPAFFKAITWSWVSQGCAIVFFIFMARTLGYNEIELHTFFFVVPIGFMVMAIPISPAGIGVGQAAFFYLFSLVLNAPTQLGPVVITAQQVFNFLFSLIGAVLYVVSSRKVPAAVLEEAN